MQPVLFILLIKFIKVASLVFIQRAREDLGDKSTRGVYSWFKHCEIVEGKFISIPNKCFTSFTRKN